MVFPTFDLFCRHPLVMPFFILCYLSAILTSVPRNIEVNLRIFLDAEGHTITSCDGHPKTEGKTRGKGGGGEGGG